MTDLSDLQQQINATRAARGFTTDPLKIHILLTEEVGEVANELKKTWSKNYDGFSKDNVADEISDVFVLLTALASSFDIDLEQAIKHKFFEKDAKREWHSQADNNE